MLGLSGASAEYQPLVGENGSSGISTGAPPSLTASPAVALPWGNRVVDQHPPGSPAEERLTTGPPGRESPRSRRALKVAQLILARNSCQPSTPQAWSPQLRFPAAAAKGRRIRDSLAHLVGAPCNPNFAFPKSIPEFAAAKRGGPSSPAREWPAQLRRVTIDAERLGKTNNETEKMQANFRERKGGGAPPAEGLKSKYA